MSINHHTPIPTTGVKATAANINSPMGELDASITQILSGVLGLDFLQVDGADPQTIATGALTPLKSVVIVDTQAAAAADDLDTISGGADGLLLFVRCANAARVVTLKHGTGNLINRDNLDIVLDDPEVYIAYLHNGTNFVDLNSIIPFPGMITWDLDADSGTPQTIDEGETVDIAGGTNIATVVGATNQVTVNFDGTLPIASGGSGQTIQQAAIDALTAVSGATNEDVLTKDTGSGNAVWKTPAGGGSLTTKGDIQGYDTGNARIPVGANDSLLVADSSAGLGVAYKTVQEAIAGKLPTDEYTANEGSDYTTTSSSFVDVDATNLKLTITTEGGDILIGFACSVTALVGANMYIDFYNVTTSEYASTYSATNDDGCLGSTANPTAFTSFGLVRLWQGLAAGTYEFRVRWKMNSSTGTIYAGAGSSSADVHPQFWIKEV